MTKLFWTDAAERAIKSGAQFVLFGFGAGVGAGTDTSFQGQIINAFLLDWRTLAGLFLGGIFLSIITSVATYGMSDRNSASIVVDIKKTL